MLTKTYVYYTLNVSSVFSLVPVHTMWKIIGVGFVVVAKSDEILPVSPPVCPDDVTVTVERSEQLATVVLLIADGSGGYTSLTESLPVGSFSYSTPAYDNQTCDFNITVTSMSIRKDLIYFAEIMLFLITMLELYEN